jgi:nucleoid DNA-binding protein
MTKRQLATVIARQNNMSHAQATAAVEATFGVIAAELMRGSEISIGGFGRFRLVQRAAREGANPRTGERIALPAHNAVRFSAANRLKASLATTDSARAPRSSGPLRSDSHLAREVARQTDLSTARAATVVDGTFETIAAELVNGEDVSVAGFGRFSVSHRAGRMGRNPMTGPALSVGAGKAARFAAAPKLKSMLAPVGKGAEAAGRAGGGAGGTGTGTGAGGGRTAGGGGRGRAKRTLTRAPAIDVPGPGVTLPERPPSGDDARRDPRPRYLLAECPDTVEVDKDFDLLVSVTLVATGKAALLWPIDVPAKGLDLLIEVHTPGSQMIGDVGRQLLHVPREADSDPLLFKLRADCAGPRLVSITAWNGGTILGELTLEVTAELNVPTSGSSASRCRMGVEAVAGAVSLVVRFDSRQDTYRFEFRDVDNPEETKSSLSYDPRAGVEDLIGTLDELTEGDTNYTPEQTHRYLKNAGVKLWRDLVPDALHKQFWGRQRRVRQLTIRTDNDIVPWELLYPKDRGRDEGFLVEQFPVVRGVFNTQPVTSLRFAPARFVLPDGAPRRAADEIDAVRKTLGLRPLRSSVLSGWTEVADLIDSGRFGLLHFACHNSLSEGRGSAITLEDREFTPVMLETAKADRALARSKPFVFINACRSAGQAPTYTRLDGWALAFLEAGAAAFAGSLWAVRDETASGFAQTLYKHLDHGRTLGDAVLKTRRSARRSGDPTWLAYSVYGDAHALVNTHTHTHARTRNGAGAGAHARTGAA